MKPESKPQCGRFWWVSY